MSKDILPLSFRPRSFNDLIGLEKLVTIIRGHAKSGRLPRAWMFAGDTGVGKTTIARILARAYQCPHVEFGSECPKCSTVVTFDILEINASQQSGVQEIGEIARSSIYAARPPSLKRVYILDEAHRLSTDAQNLLLKYFEADNSSAAIWIICTTNAAKIIKTLRSRCMYYELPNLRVDGVKLLVTKAIAHSGQRKEAGPLIDALLEKAIFSPRLVLVAVEKYLSGASPDQASSVDSIEMSVDSLRLCRAVVNGNLPELRPLLKTLPSEESRAVTQAVMGYINSVIIGSTDARQLAIGISGIQRLSALGYLDDGMRKPALVAILMDLTLKFAGKRLPEI